MRVLGLVVAIGALAVAATAHAQAVRSYDPDVVIASDLDEPEDDGSLYGRSGRVIEPPHAILPPAPPPAYGPTAYGPAVLSPRDVLRIARAGGFSPLGPPQQRGWVYTITVIDPAGEDGRLVIDARSGRILRFRPAYRFGGRSGGGVDMAYGMTLRGGGAYGPPVRPPASIPNARRAATPLPKSRIARLPDTTGALAQANRGAAASAVPPAPTAALAVAPVAASAAVPPAPPAAKPAATIQPTQPMPPVQGFE
jgi:hypothetical protein